jgi:pyridoxamine 5'-phosphate oxidase
MQKIESLRKNYSLHSLSESNVKPSPIDQFIQWFDEANDAKVHEPNAFVLSTSSTKGIPSSRVVLLKGCSHEGFTFFTNYESHKGQEISSNPHVSLCFLWHEMERQVRIQGVASKVSREETARYFHSRPRESQIGAWVSPQSQIIEDDLFLSKKYAEIEAKYQGIDPIPVPDHWGGFIIAPTEIEFWQGRPSRLHDRIRYTLENHQWTTRRLAP